MKDKIHPKYGPVIYRCASCKTEVISGSTKLDGKVEVVDGVEHHVIALEICSSCHPFYTGRKSFIDSAGRVEKFNKRFKQPLVSKKKAKKETVAS